MLGSMGKYYYQEMRIVFFLDINVFISDFGFFGSIV